jgi:hypothetical protein
MPDSAHNLAAAASGSGICDFINKFNSAVVNPILLLIFALGTLAFVLGVVEFMLGLQQGQGSEKKEDGRRHMLWGLVGMFIMVSAWSVIKLIAGMVGSNLSCNF